MYRPKQNKGDFMKNKILFLAALLALGMTSCGGSNNQPSAQPSTPDTTSAAAPSSEATPTTSAVTPSSTPVAPSSNPTVPSSTPATSKPVEQSSTPVSQPSSQPVQSSEPAEEQPQDKDLMLLLGMEYGGEAVPGKLVYWTGEGASVNFSEGKGDDSDYLIMDYTAGSQWYGFQLFIATPYGEAGDDVRVEFDIIPSVGGDVTLNGQVFTLKANEVNHIKYRTTVAANLRAVDMQFGKYAGNVFYPSATFKVAQPVIKPFNGVYHKASFGMMVGTQYSEMLSYYVKDGKTLFYVIDSAEFAEYLPEGMVLKGWKDSEGNYASLTTVVTSDVQYVMEIVNESQIVKHDVVYKLGEQAIHTDKVNDGVPASAPTLAWNEVGFGYAVVGFFDDQALTQAHDFTANVSADQVIYVKRVMNPTTYVQWGWAQTATFVATDSKYTASGLNCGTAPGNQGWNVQINFANVPAENGVNYKLSFKYKLTAQANGNAQVWDGQATTGFGVSELVCDGQEHLVEKTYSGSDYSIDVFEKLTFELGVCGDNTAIEIYELALVVVA